MAAPKKPWGGRFTEETEEIVEEFTASLAFDRRLASCDIEGSIAHAAMLARQGVITDGERDVIVNGLKEVLGDIEAGTFLFEQKDEDIHMAVERALISRIGEVGGKLHAGRSRNDQVALDLRLFLRRETAGIIDAIGRLKGAFCRVAETEIDTIIPGFTHLQKAQPVLLAHYLLAYREMFHRDEGRFRDCLGRMNVLPLGSAALAGTGIPISREYVAELLDFPCISENSMDAVSDRDFAAEFLFASSLLMMHMSRFCEDLIIWSSGDYGYVEIADAFTTGSSIMPQKKNPDVAELIRGKTGRVYGNLMTLLTVLKGLPMTYNRDLQEDKEPLFDTVDTVKRSVAVLTGMIGRLTFHRERLFEAAGRGFSTAADLAEYLVGRGVPFREAHHIVGRIVRCCIDEGRDLPDLILDDFRRFDGRFDEDVLSVLSVEDSVNRRRHRGGTSKAGVRARLKEIEKDCE